MWGGRPSQPACKPLATPTRRTDTYSPLRRPQNCKRRITAIQISKNVLNRSKLHFPVQPNDTTMGPALSSPNQSRRSSPSWRWPLPDRGAGPREKALLYGIGTTIMTPPLGKVIDQPLPYRGQVRRKAHRDPPLPPLRRLLSSLFINDDALLRKLLDL